MKMLDIFGGIDVGNRSINAVILNNNQILVSYSQFTHENAVDGAMHILEKALEISGNAIDDLNFLVATGAGRKWINFADKKSSEIVCQAIGAYFLYSKALTIINLGAESYRAINVNEKGTVTNYVENDKCAAGSGVFLEEMSAALDVDIERAGELCLNSVRSEKITTFCAVFAESEVVSAIHRGIPQDEILAGVHEAISERIVSLVRRVKPGNEIVLTGSLSKNPCIKKMIEEKTGLPVIIPENPETVGALGAALQGRK